MLIFIFSPDGPPIRYERYGGTYPPAEPPSVGISPQHPQIPCKGGRIAGDVNNSLRRHFEYLRYHILMHSDTRRINNQHLRYCLYLHKRVFYIPQNEAAVGNAVRAAISFCVRDGTFYNFNADHLFCGIRKPNTDRSRAAI